jgi:plastocyanin
VYNLRGATPSPSSYPETEGSSELDRLVIILEGVAARSKSPETVVIDQRNMRFEPELVVVPVGSTVQFRNADPIFHNIFSLSKTQPFDLGYYSQGRNRTASTPTCTPRLW